MPTIKQKRAAKLVIENETIDKPLTGGQIVENSGYGVSMKKNPQVVLNSEGVKEAIKSFADRIDDDKIEKVLNEGLEANKIISANITYGDADEKTNDFIEVPDHAVRHKFFDSAVKIKGLYAPDKSVNVNIDIDTASPEARALAEEFENKLKGKL